MHLWGQGGQREPSGMSQTHLAALKRMPETEVSERHPGAASLELWERVCEACSWCPRGNSLLWRWRHALSLHVY